MWWPIDCSRKKRTPFKRDNLPRTPMDSQIQQNLEIPNADEKWSSRWRIGLWKLKRIRGELSKAVRKEKREKKREWREVEMKRIKREASWVLDSWWSLADRGLSVCRIVCESLENRLKSKVWISRIARKSSRFARVFNKEPATTVCESEPANGYETASTKEPKAPLLATGNVDTLNAFDAQPKLR